MLLTRPWPGRPDDSRWSGGRAVPLVLAVLSVGALASCAADPPPPAGPAQAAVAPPLSTASPSAASPRDLAPIHALVHTWTPADERAQAAEQRLTVDCMARAGFRYRPVPPPPAGSPVEVPKPFGLESLDPAEVASPAAVPGESPVPQAERFGRALYGDGRKLTVRGARISVGVPAAGCLAEAETRLSGPDRLRWEQVRILLYEAEAQAQAQLAGDPEYRASIAAWRACLHRTGFTVDEPTDVLTALRPGADPHADATARADLRCKTETDFLRRGYARLGAIQAGLLARDPSVVADWRRVGDRRDVVARQVLAQPPTT